jgi:hypothetical protein
MRVEDVDPMTKLEDLQQRRDEAAKTLAELDEWIEEAKKAEAEQWFYIGHRMRTNRDGTIEHLEWASWRELFAAFPSEKWRARAHAALFDAAMAPRVDTDFIAHAREDIPALLEEIARLTRERDNAQIGLKQWRDKALEQATENGTLRARIAELEARERELLEALRMSCWTRREIKDRNGYVTGAEYKCRYCGRVGDDLEHFDSCIVKPAARDGSPGE